MEENSSYNALESPSPLSPMGGTAIVDPEETMTITPLGAGNEVGRSCHILKFQGKTVMLDCGIHPAYNGIAALPFFDEIEPSEIDIILITHFHLDHAASLPYFTERTNFKGRVFMTHPTKAIFKWLLSDYVKVSNVSVDEMLYDEADLNRCYDKIEALDYHQQVELDGIKFTAFNAGHVLGAAMFLIEIAGVKVLYTGDYSTEEDRHLMAAEKPKGQTDVLICESTYGVQSHEPRAQREHRFTSLVHEIVQRGGRCLIPVFALGRAQELLLILDEYWQTHPELHGVPIYYASSLAKKCMKIYQTYINVMNERIRKQFTISNPFIFKHISNLKSMEHFEDTGACVMMASPEMLQSGLSRELFELWCPDAKNGVIIPGYCVEGTLAKHILNEPTEVQSMSGGRLPLKMSVEYISFSAHVDFTQNSTFIDSVNPSHLILVHGDSNEMSRLRGALQRRYEENDEKKTIIHTPRNCEVVELHFMGEKYAKVIGRKARREPQENDTISGILVTKNYENFIIDPFDLKEFTDVSTCSIFQRQVVQISAAFSLVEFHLERMFGSAMERIPGEGSSDTIQIMEAIEIKQLEDGKGIAVEWKGDPVYDVVADSVLTVLLCLEFSKSSIQATKSKHSHSHSNHDEEKIKEETTGDDSVIKVEEEYARVDENFFTNTSPLVTPLNKEHRAQVLRMYLSEYYEEVYYDPSADEFAVAISAGGSAAVRATFSPSRDEWKVKCADAEAEKRLSNILTYCKTLCQADLLVFQP